MKRARSCLVILCVGWVAVAGCRDAPSSDSAADDAPAPGATDVATDADSAAPESVPEASGASGGVSPRAQTGSIQPIQGIVDPFLTTQLRVFIQQNGRLPESFGEFAGARLDSVPRLSRGLAFAIDPATHEVKIVRQ